MKSKLNRAVSTLTVAGALALSSGAIGVAAAALHAKPLRAEDAPASTSVEAKPLRAESAPTGANQILAKPLRAE